MAKVKNFFRKIGKWFSAHRPTKRRLIQLYAALLTNANVKGFATGKIYQGATKNLCVPGLNCYSCPGAIGACPLGSLQNALAASSTRAPAYVFGIIVLFGLLLGRTICGFLCPFGLIQELLYKIKTPKVKKSVFTRVLSYFKYVLLVLLIAIPLIYASVPAFCKFICPAGTLEGAIGLLSNPNNADFFAMLGGLFTWKFVLLVAFIVASVFIFRFFCRFFCPLGAIYGFFCKIALLGVKLDKSKCIDCGLCLKTCKMDVKRVGDHECIQCGECLSVCPTKAISWKGSSLFVHASSAEAVFAPAEEPRPLGALLAASATEDRTDAPDSECAATLDVSETVGATSGECVQEPVFVDAEEGRETVETDAPRRGRAFWLRLCAICCAGIVLLAALVYYNFFSSGWGGVVLKEGERCTPFTLELYQTANENTVFSIEASKGKVTVINFWETTCDPCVEELPYFEKVNREYNGEIVMVAVHSTHVTEPVQKFIDKEDREKNKESWSEYTMMMAVDREDVNAYEMLGGKGAYPITVILDQEGVITCIRQGKMPETELRAEIIKAMG